MGNLISQSFFIPAARITEKNCPDQTGRVFVVTGGYAGIGFELCKILYAHNATVWIAGRSETKAQKALASLEEASPKSRGRLRFLFLDLADFSTIKAAVSSFLSQEDRLDVLVNNAGVMFPPNGSVDAHGNDLQLSTNCLGPYLLYQLLLPLLTKTAASSPTGTVRVAWASSIGIDMAAPWPHGISLGDDGCPEDLGVKPNYIQSKAGNVLLARELARTTAQTGVVHASFSPGVLHSDLHRYWSGLDYWIALTFFAFPTIYGAYTELWTILAPELTPDRSGAHVYPWGRFGSLPARLEKSSKNQSDGGTGIGEKFVEWCHRETHTFM
ncbi:NAD(P)-binding protein [Xylariomycetidae sp. FL2044]|nr:NAD(P)-binding protein [Xylariomycetidae sp. FL2044]